MCEKNSPEDMQYFGDSSVLATLPMSILVAVGKTKKCPHLISLDKGALQHKQTMHGRVVIHIRTYAHATTRRGYRSCVFA